MEGIVKSTLDILNLIAFLLGSPDYVAVRFYPAPRNSSIPTLANPPKRLAKKAGS
jgi:hypothetical protein